MDVSRIKNCSYYRNHAITGVFVAVHCEDSPSKHANDKRDSFFIPFTVYDMKKFSI